MPLPVALLQGSAATTPGTVLTTAWQRWPPAAQRRVSATRPGTGPAPCQTGRVTRDSARRRRPGGPDRRPMAGLGPARPGPGFMPGPVGRPCPARGQAAASETAVAGPAGHRRRAESGSGLAEPERSHQRLETPWPGCYYLVLHGITLAAGISLPWHACAAA